MHEKVIILSGSSLCKNPRVLKEATSLAAAGLQVEVLGAWFDVASKAEDESILASVDFRFVPVIDATHRSRFPALGYLPSRLISKFAHWLYRATGYCSRWQLGLAVGPLATAARSRSFDLAIAHSESAMAVAADLFASGHRVGIDLEDWFSEDLLPDARRYRPLKLLRRLEGQALRGWATVACPSRSMGDALAGEFDCLPPAVIYNAFRWSERAAIDGVAKDRTGMRRTSIHWYSQTLGSGRGLEDLFAALPHVRSDVEVHLRGRPAEGFEKWVLEVVQEKWRNRVFFHPLVANAELVSRIAEHDIGFAGEMKFCRSRDLTVSNKILHYFLGGLAVVASDTTGQQEVASRAPGAVLLYTSGDPRQLAERIDSLANSGLNLSSARAAALKAAEETFCWEKQEPLLVRSILSGLTSAAARKAF